MASNWRDRNSESRSSGALCRRSTGTSAISAAIPTAPAISTFARTPPPAPPPVQPPRRALGQRVDQAADAQHAEQRARHVGRQRPAAAALGDLAEREQAG